MKHEAPPILGPLEFEGLENRLILIEKDEAETLSLLKGLLSGKNNVIFQPKGIEISPPEGFDDGSTYTIFVDSIYKIENFIKKINEESESESVDFYIINEIEGLDLNLNKRAKGSQTKAYLSLLSSARILRGANLIVTSQKEEYMIRELADKHYKLR